MGKNIRFFILFISRYKNFRWSVVHTNMCKTSSPENITEPMTDKLLTNSMLQNPSWEAHTSWVNQEIPCIHKKPPLVSILNQKNSNHALPFYFLNIHFNIIFSCTPSPSKWFLSIDFPQWQIPWYG